MQWTSEITEYHEAQRVEMRFGGFFGRIADPVVTKMYSRDVRSNLETLKILLEEG